MRKIKNRHVYIVTFVIVLIMGYRGLGGFAHLEVKEQEFSGYTAAYVSFTGDMLDYHANIEKVEKALKGKGIKEIGEISIYHDLYTDKRCSTSKNDGGIIIDPQDVAKLDKKSSVYKIMTIPAGKKMVISFPYKGGGSCMIGHIRGTKAMREYLKSYNNEYAPVIEYYNTKDNIIYYITDVQK